MPSDDAVSVRPARPEDVEAVRRVARRAWYAAHEPIVGEAAVEAFLDEHYDAASVEGRIEREAGFLLVATDPAVVGFAAAGPDDEVPGRYHLTQCYVDPDRWGEGIGGRLLERVEAAVRERGGDRLRLGVMAENDRARGFYEAAGYRPVDEFYDDRLDVDGVTYEKALR